MERDTSGRFTRRTDMPQGQQSYTPQQAADDSCTSSMMTTGFFTVLGGAALGAVAMYLMDPEKGSDRRSIALEAAQRALEATSGAARSAYQSTASAVGSAWE